MIQPGRERQRTFSAVPRHTRNGSDGSSALANTPWPRLATRPHSAAAYKTTPNRPSHVNPTANAVIAMSSPIPIPIPIPAPYASRTESSPGLYVPIHRRNQSTASSYTSSSSSRTRSPSPLSSTRTYPTPCMERTLTSHTARYVYTPADLFALSRSPLAQLEMGDMDARLRAIAPEVVKTRKQRKALAWHGRHPTTESRGRRRESHAPQTSESEEDRASTWRRA